MMNTSLNHFLLSMCTARWFTSIVGMTYMMPDTIIMKSTSLNYCSSFLCASRWLVLVIMSLRNFLLSSCVP